MCVCVSSQATATWERAAHLIEQRESLLARLELFERDASDPNRFFLQGYWGTSLARMDESKHRSKLNSQICSLEKVLSKILHHITDSFHDTVAYKGRPYREKMRWDRIEMLYWVQQEGRVQALERVVEGRGSLPTRLPPLNPNLRLYPGTHPTPQGHTLTLSQRLQPHTHTTTPTQPSRAQCIQYKFERCKQMNKMLGKWFVCTAWKEILYLFICMYSYYV
uniref:Uncharacterized protein n=1 Tax=Hucho hucho TaxID=62062 RepID=A0A4W5N3B5_9TELE